MKHIHLLGFLFFGLGFVLLGCQQRPAVPTVPIEPTEPVLVVVVTATRQPTLAPTPPPEPTITPLPTFTPIVTATTTPTLQAQVTRAPTRTAQPTASAAQATATLTGAGAQPTGAPASFAAPQALEPQGLFVRPGDSITIKFTSVGPLAADQCYRIRMFLSMPGDPSGVDDYWVPRDLCGNQSNAGDVLTFLLKPGRFRDEPNYGTLLNVAESIIPPTPQFDMRWFVDVVRLVDTSDAIHPTVEASSPPSASLPNSFSR